MPLQSVAQSDYGDIKMTLVDYQPGNGHRLRPCRPAAAPIEAWILAGTLEEPRKALAPALGR